MTDRDAAERRTLERRPDRLAASSTWANMTMVMITMVMQEKTISATRFKAHCLKLMDTVAETGEVLVVTKHNRPVVRVVAAEPAAPLRGSVRYLVSDEELIAPINERWDAMG
ncbi:MAG: type II toxin-antitoxin system Phd/YefM family antitoxin [Chloroflexota bacterium]